MESIELISDQIPDETPEAVKDNAEVIQALYDVGAKITEVIAKMSEMTEKIAKTEPTDETEVIEDNDETAIIDEKEDND